MSVKVDLHVHTKFSDRSAEWVLRRVDFPASMSEPQAVYDSLKAKGMRFVTFTDNNCIDACLELAHLPDTFISEKVTTYFPEDDCKAQLLVWDITEEQHAKLTLLRKSIYELQTYLQQEKIAHTVAHPLYSVNQRLRTQHVEKLILLFKHFETINGMRDALLNKVLTFNLSRLTPAKIEELATRHKIQPTHPEPWIKVSTGGSDDHGGFYPASAYTECDEADTIADFLTAVRTGDCRPCGSGGTPVALSHSLYNILFQFLKGKVGDTKGPTLELLEKAFSRFMEGENPTRLTVGEKVGFIAQGIVTGKIFDLANPGHTSLLKELSRYVENRDIKSMMDRETAGIAEPERRAFIMANMLANQLTYQFFRRFIKEISSGNLIASIESVSAMVPVLLLLSPYIYSFQSQAPEREWLGKLSLALTGSPPESLKNNKRAWVTDTLDDVNGVANTIRRMTAAAQENDADITVITCASQLSDESIPLKNFEPIGEFELPEYELQKLSFPPILEIIDYIQRNGFTEVIISTPGPTGLAALLAAKMLGLRTSGIYHTDFPQYVRILTDDNFLETLTWNFMHWFYRQFDLVYVNSEHYRQCWIERGIKAEKIHILPRGLDLELFRAERRAAGFWKQRGLNDGEVGILYVGRVSKEKDLDVLADAYQQLRTENLPVRLLIVGDGPYREHLTQTLPTAIFTGVLSGKDLATAYASADLFAFPSTTDTFGNVILEAQASALPCVVSDEGGPRELIDEGITGRITKALDREEFTAALRDLSTNATLRTRMSQAARDAIKDRSWPNAFQQFWDTAPLHADSDQR